MGEGMRTDPETGASYFRLTDAEIMGTRHVSDLIMVDLDKTGEPVGVEFAGSSLPSAPGWKLLFEAFPSLAAPLSTYAGGRRERRDVNQVAHGVVGRLIGATDDPGLAFVVIDTTGWFAPADAVAPSPVSGTTGRAPADA